MPMLFLAVFLIGSVGIFILINQKADNPSVDKDLRKADMEKKLNEKNVKRNAKNVKYK